jgi:hypothetical protein
MKHDTSIYLGWNRLRRQALDVPPVALVEGFPDIILLGNG